MAILLSNTFGIGETITYLAGDQFCSQPDFLEQEGMTAKCQEYLWTLLPVSLPLSAAQLKLYAPQLCMTLFELCHDAN